MGNVKITKNTDNTVKEVYAESIEVAEPFIVISSSVWQQFSIIPKEKLIVEADGIKVENNYLIEKGKASKIKEINIACGNEIESGFISNALGTEYTYQSEQIDQLNLIGLVASGTDDYFKAGVTDVDGNITWNYELHTIGQLKQVLEDGKAHKQTLLQKANTLKAQVNTATTQADLDAIVW